MNMDRDDPILRRARDAFEAAVDDIDPGTANRLRLARRAALSTRDSRRGWLLPLAGAAAMGLVAWLAWPRAQAPATAPGPVATLPATPAPSVVAVPEPPVIEDRPVRADVMQDDVMLDDVMQDDVIRDDANPVAVIPDSMLDAPIDEQLPIDDDTDWAALDEDDAEIYAWLADAPVAPETQGDAL
jgi:hypothetical protein